MRRALDEGLGRCQLWNSGQPPLLAQAFQRNTLLQRVFVGVGADQFCKLRNSRGGLGQVAR